MSFADSFWSLEYDKGFKVLFEQLYQGVLEDDDFIALFTARMELELLYGTQLETIKVNKNSSQRQTNDDYVSLIKNSYQKMNENFAKQGELHVQIAANIKQLVLDPFSHWCKEHKQRVEFSEDTLLDKNKQFRAGKTALEKLQKKYFNKCRMLEEFKGHYTEEEFDVVAANADEAETSVDADADADASVNGAELNGADDGESYSIGHLSFTTASLKTFLSSILASIPKKSHKVAILGTYTNVSTGSAITQWLLDNKESDFNHNLARAEEFGQDLIDHGFIRLIGSMNKNFINSSQFFYQWKPLAFEMAGIQEHPLGRSDSVSSSQTAASGSPSTLAAASAVGLSDYLEDMKLAMGVNTVDFTDRTQLAKLIKDVNTLDLQYYDATVDLDLLRCEYEELIMDHLTFMQKCELDRMRAVKKATFDFLSCFANKVSSLKLTCDELIILEETIQPINDLKFFIENYQTGRFKPQVILYDNYYNSNIRQTFGVDLAVKSRLDRKVVPIIIQCLLSKLDQIYPDLENDEERVNLWIKPVPLTKVHQLRLKLNELTTPQEINEVLDSNNVAGGVVHPLIITNIFKLYLMELPDSVIPHSVYDLIKSLYTNYPFGSSDQSVNDSRINGIQNVLVDLPKCNVATLDAILTHLNRLVQIIGLKNQKLSTEFKTTLSREFGGLILRPKGGDYSLEGYIHDKHQYNLMNDLFEYKDGIFKELRRRASTRVSSGQQHPQPSSRNGRHDQTDLPSGPKRAATQSKNRLESRLQNAVHKQKDSKNNEVTETSEINQIDASEPSPSTPKKDNSLPTSGSSLRRSVSPNKKKLNSLVEPSNLSPIVSSRPRKKDIIYDTSNSGSLESLGQPKFAPTLARKTSVKDLASRFDSPSPEKKNEQ